MFPSHHEIAADILNHKAVCVAKVDKLSGLFESVTRNQPFQSSNSITLQECQFLGRQCPQLLPLSPLTKKS